MPNISQFPIDTEFVRAYSSIVSEECLSDIALYPLRSFRVLTSEFNKIMSKALVEANKNYDRENAEAARHLLNYHINAGLLELHENGGLISADKFAGVMLNDIAELKAFENKVIVTTCDGYTVFNPVFIPPVSSPTLN